VLGQRINNFEIVRLLGQGGMGSVYEAEHRLIRKKVAVKFLRPELAAQGDLMQRFFNEARATSAIHHPNIVEVIDLGTLPDGVPYLVMELLEGESLGDRLHRLGRLPIGAAVELACQTASALQAAHDKGIVHRDLKPDNLFLVRDQRFEDRELVKVLDFGIAKLRTDLSPSPVDTMAGTIWGTPTYMSPEQCRGVPDSVDHRSDIYSLGVIVYEAICGQPPFSSEGTGDLMMMHMSEEPEKLSRLEPSVTPQIEQAVLKALAKRPEQRFGRMLELANALRAGAGAVIALPQRHQSTLAAGSVAANGTVQGAVALAIARPEGSVGACSDAGDGTEQASETLVTSKHVKSLGAQPPASPPPAPVGGALGEDLPASALRRWSLVAGGALVVLGAIVAVWMRSAAPSNVAQPASAAKSVTAVVPSPAPPVLDAPHLPASAVAPSPASSVQSTPHATADKSAREPSTSRGKSSKNRASTAAQAHAPERSTAIAQAASATPTAEAPPAIAAAPQTPAAPGKLAPGYLNLDSEPWANVSLNGKALGTTPLMHVALPPGKHVLTLSNPELGLSTSYAVEIQSGVVLSRLVGWRKP
jgi:serine/threonine-protein kinase